MDPVATRQVTNEISAVETKAVSTGEIRQSLGNEAYIHSALC